MSGNEFEWQVYGSGDVSQSGLILDQSSTVWNSSGYGLYYIRWQSFTAGVTKNFLKISVALTHAKTYFGTFPVGSYYKFYIYNTSGGIPTTLLATSINSVDYGKLPLNQTIWVDFDFNIALTSGTKYAIVSQQTDVRYYVGWAFSNTSNYANGNAGYYSQGIFQQWTNFDNTFKTYYEQITAGSEFNQESSIKIEQRKRFL